MFAVENSKLKVENNSGVEGGSIAEQGSIECSQQSQLVRGQYSSTIGADHSTDM